MWWDTERQAYGQADLPTDVMAETERERRGEDGVGWGGMGGGGGADGQRHKQTESGPESGTDRQTEPGRRASDRQRAVTTHDT